MESNEPIFIVTQTHSVACQPLSQSASLKMMTWQGRKSAFHSSARTVEIFFVPLSEDQAGDVFLRLASLGRQKFLRFFRGVYEFAFLLCNNLFLSLLDLFLLVFDEFLRRIALVEDKR